MPRPGFAPGPRTDFMSSRSLLFRWITDDLVVVLGTKAFYDDPDWDSFVGSFTPRRRAAGDIRLIVYNAKAGPTPAQQARLRCTTRCVRVREAVVTSSPFTRAAVNALRLFGLPMIAMPPDREDDAFRHLSLSAEEARLVHENVGLMRAKCSARHERKRPNSAAPHVAI